jgi:hypothetical protein
MEEGGGNICLSLGTICFVCVGRWGLMAVMLSDNSPILNLQYTASGTLHHDGCTKVQCSLRLRALVLYSLQYQLVLVLFNLKLAA